jgi:hypothetical protein
MDKIFNTQKSSSMPSSGHHTRRESGQYYFVPREPAVTGEVKEKGDEDPVIEIQPEHAGDDTYEPKPVNRSLSLVRLWNCFLNELVFLASLLLILVSCL